jgi:hypothetical protein
VPQATDVHVLDLGEHGGGRRAECGLQQATVGHALGQRVGDGARLFVDFLEHEVRYWPFSAASADSSLSRTGRSALSPFLSSTLIEVRRMSATSPSSRNMKRRVTGSSAADVRGDEVLVDAETHDHRATFARQDDALRFGFTDYRQA